jgi:hypothetical protein
MEEVIETLARLEPPLSYVSTDTTTNLLIHDEFSVMDLQTITGSAQYVTVIYSTSWICTSGYQVR